MVTVFKNQILVDLCITQPKLVILSPKQLLWKDCYIFPLYSTFWEEIKLARNYREDSNPLHNFFGIGKTSRQATALLINSEGLLFICSYEVATDKEKNVDGAISVIREIGHYKDTILSWQASTTAPERHLVVQKDLATDVVDLYRRMCKRSAFIQHLRSPYVVDCEQLVEFLKLRKKDETLELPDDLLVPVPPPYVNIVELTLDIIPKLEFI